MTQIHAIELATEIITLILLWYVARTTNAKLNFLKEEQDRTNALLDGAIDEISGYEHRRGFQLRENSAYCMNCHKETFPRGLCRCPERNYADGTWNEKVKAEEKRLAGDSAFRVEKTEERYAMPRVVRKKRVEKKNGKTSMVIAGGKGGVTQKERDATNSYVDHAEKPIAPKK